MSAYDSVLPGDFILCHRPGPIAAGIVLGQRARRIDPTHAHWSHVALVGDGHLIEALTHKGVQHSPLDKYDGTDHKLVRMPFSDQDRAQVLAFAESCVGYTYGWTSIASLGITAVSGGKFGFEREGTLICSGLVAHALTRGWEVFDTSPSRVMPGDLAVKYLSSPGRGANGAT